MRFPEVYDPWLLAVIPFGDQPEGDTSCDRARVHESQEAAMGRWPLRRGDRVAGQLPHNCLKPAPRFCGSSFLPSFQCYQNARRYGGRNKQQRNRPRGIAAEQGGKEGKDDEHGQGHDE